MTDYHKRSISAGKMYSSFNDSSCRMGRYHFGLGFT